MCVCYAELFVAMVILQGCSHIPENGVEEYHRLRQSLAMLGFGTELQMGCVCTYVCTHIQWNPSIKDIIGE